MEREILLDLGKKLNEEMKKQYEDKEKLSCRILSEGREKDGEVLSIDIIKQGDLGKDYKRMISAGVFIHDNINMKNDIDQKKILALILNQIKHGIFKIFKIKPLENKEQDEHPEDM